MNREQRRQAMGSGTEELVNLGLTYAQWAQSNVHEWPYSHKQATVMARALCVLVENYDRELLGRMQGMPFGYDPVPEKSGL